MPEFFSTALLATPAGVVLATTLTTQFLKGLIPEKIPTRLVSFVIALSINTVILITTSSLTLVEIMLCLINSVVASLASNGAYDAVVKK